MSNAAPTARFCSRDGLLIAAFTLIVAFGFQGSRGLWEPDEGLFVSVAGTMLDNGDWLVPHMNGQPYPEKPPLMYWGMAAGMKIFGKNEFGARAFYALCFALTVWLVWKLAAMFWGRREAVIASLFYASMIVPLAGANTARPDTTLALCTTAAILSFWKSLEGSYGHKVLWKMLMCAAFGVGFMAKGPAVLLPTAPIFIWLLIQGRPKDYFFTVWAIPGVLIFLALGLSWYVYIAKTVPGTAAYFWDNQVAGRLVSSKYKRNPGLLNGLRVYLPVLTAGALPCAALWPTLVNRFRPKVFSKDWWFNLRKRPVALLLTLWFCVPLALLMAASSKLPLYILPLSPALALITARGVTLCWPTEFSLNKKRWITVGVAGWAVFLLGAKFASGMYPRTDKDERLIWETIKANPATPADCDRVLVVDEELNGISIYSGLPVTSVTTPGRKHNYPNFVRPRLITEELVSTAASGRPYIVITNRWKRPEDFEKFRALLESANVAYQEFKFPKPFHQGYYICRGGPKKDDIDVAQGPAN
jgi:4-amino-4-deoxy-L-arabinose transferase-like glycosyltransferase